MLRQLQRLKAKLVMSRQTKAPTTAGVDVPRPVKKPVDSRWCGLRDASLSGWFNHETGELLDGFEVGASDVLLDLGCGEGGLTLFCAKQGPHVVISDIEADKVATLKLKLQASEARKVEAFVCDSVPLPIDDGYVTKVMAMEMLEHVEDPKAVVAEIARVARSGAQVLLSVPSQESENFQRGIAPEAYFSSPNHVRTFSEQSFVELVEGAGLVVERKLKWGFFWTMWMSMHWLAERHAGRELSGAALDKVAPPYTQVLDDWATTWNQIIMMPEGKLLKEKLDTILPKSMAIIARKP